MTTRTRFVRFAVFALAGVGVWHITHGVLSWLR